MAQTSEGAAKFRAARAGVTLDELRQREVGEKWCWACGSWASRAAFNRDASRYDGLSARCRACTRVKERVNTKGRPSPMKGRRFSETARANMGRPAGFVSEKRGRARTPEERAAISRAVRQSPNLRCGAACHTYVDGRGAERLGLRHTAAFKQWRFDVYLRDAFTCRDCGDARGGNLHAHHIKPFASHPELRFDVSNGVTLCDGCHRARHASGNL